MKVKPNNYIAIEFPSRSVNEGLARAAVAAFAAQLDPTLDELGDIKTAVSEALYTTGGEERSGMGFTIMESFMDSLAVRSKNGKGTVVTMKRRIALRTARR